MIKSYLWTHSPLLPDAPEDIIHHFQHAKEEEVYEVAVFRLANGKFIYVSYASDFSFDDEVGITEIEEFDNLDDAAKLFFESTK